MIKPPKIAAELVVAYMRVYIYTQKFFCNADSSDKTRPLHDNVQGPCAILQTQESNSHGSQKLTPTLQSSS